MKFRYVEQADPAGCGVACAAMITGLAYAAVAARYQADLAREPTDLAHAREFVCGHGFSAVQTQAHARGLLAESNRRMLRPFADVHILRVLPYVDSKTGHFVVMDRRGRVYDPQSPGRIDPSGYYFVTHAVGFFDERRKCRP